jgi:hypothetical protein
MQMPSTMASISSPSNAKPQWRNAAVTVRLDGAKRSPVLAH